MSEEIPYWKQLQDKVENLTDIIDGKDLQMRILENEMVDVTAASAASSKTTLLILHMMMELNLHVQKKGWTAPAKASQERLVKLLELNRELDGMNNQNLQLKSINRDLHAQYQLLRIENKELKKKLDDIVKAENY